MVANPAVVSTPVGSTGRCRLLALGADIRSMERWSHHPRRQVSQEIGSVPALADRRRSRSVVETRPVDPETWQPPHSAVFNHLGKAARGIFIKAVPSSRASRQWARVEIRQDEVPGAGRSRQAPRLSCDREGTSPDGTCIRRASGKVLPRSRARSGSPREHSNSVFVSTLRHGVADPPATGRRAGGDSAWAHGQVGRMATICGGPPPRTKGPSIGLDASADVMTRPGNGPCCASSGAVSRPVRSA